MHGPRAQADKRAYQQEIKRICRSAAGPDAAAGDRRGSARRRRLARHGQRSRRRAACAADAVYRARAVVLCAGHVHAGRCCTIGEADHARRPDGRADHVGLSQALARLGFRLARFKTGTPPRLNGRTIDYAKTELQPGDDEPEPFSFLTERIDCEQIPCWITYTNAGGPRADPREPAPRADVHRPDSIDRAALLPVDRDQGRPLRRQGRGTSSSSSPRAATTHEVYVNGLSTSLPRDVQDAMVRLIPGLEQAEILRYGYAIEYDYVPPDQLQPSLETKRVAGLYLAGPDQRHDRLRGGRRQGLMAGVNAALALAGQGAAGAAAATRPTSA